ESLSGSYKWIWLVRLEEMISFPCSTDKYTPGLVMGSLDMEGTLKVYRGILFSGSMSYWVISFCLKSIFLRLKVLSFQLETRTKMTPGWLGTIIVLSNRSYAVSTSP